jgi:hypothetical protein
VQAKDFLKKKSLFLRHILKKLSLSRRKNNAFREENGKYGKGERL